MMIAEGSCAVAGKTAYELLDEEIGWERRRYVEWPSIEKAEKLVLQAAGGSLDAFRELFEIRRWALHAYTPEQKESAAICERGFIGAKGLFGG